MTRKKLINAKIDAVLCYIPGLLGISPDTKIKVWPVMGKINGNNIIAGTTVPNDDMIEVYLSVNEMWTDEQIINALIHELVHVRQYEMGLTWESYERAFWIFESAAFEIAELLEPVGRKFHFMDYRKSIAIDKLTNSNSESEEVT